MVGGFSLQEIPFEAGSFLIPAIANFLADGLSADEIYLLADFLTAVTDTLQYIARHKLNSEISSGRRRSGQNQTVPFADIDDVR